MLNAEYTARVDAVKRRAHGRWTTSNTSSRKAKS